MKQFILSADYPYEGANFDEFDTLADALVARDKLVSNPGTCFNIFVAVVLVQPVGD